MSYIPSLNDIPIENNKGAYKPTLSDIPSNINDLPSTKQHAPASQRNPGTLERAADIAQKYVIDPIDAAKAGLGQAATTFHNFVFKPADYLYGTNFVEAANRDQQARDKEFDRRFGNNLGAKALRLGAKEAAEWYLPVKWAKPLNEGIKFLNKTPMRRAIGENVIAGGLYGGLNNPDDPRAIAESMAIGGGAGFAGGLASKFISQPLAGLYARSTIPSFIKKASEKIKILPAPEIGTNQLKQSYIKSADENLSNWTNTEKLAKNLDQSLASPFDSSPYLKHVDDYIAKVEGFTPAKRAQYQESFDFAKQIRETPPTNFEDITLLRQSLNDTLGNFTKKRGLDKSDKYTQEFVKEVKNNLVNETLHANANKVSPELYQQFTKQWEKANKSHQYLQEFYKGIGKTGALAPKKMVREGFQKADQIDPAIISEYMPKPSQTNISGFKQLEKLLGSKKATQDAAKSYYFRNILENGGTPQDIASLYGKLSPKQRNYLFGQSKEGDLLNSINKTMLTAGKQKKGEKWLGHGLSFGVPGLLGIETGLEAGLKWDEALILGALTGMAGSGGEALMGKIANPRTVEKALNFYEKGGKRPGLLTNMIAQDYFGRPEE